ncbi:hypothetical protein P7K49_024784 [Saguinus oedipus]|uniref:Uncharacterized protein n=1 Tax=Saguinus oedipus TaxID=9490 RepID=A0ABQ9UQH5_SAGOE|nr:hypothetical protein P7K49_024784 [Saguinus oedipus]
MTWTTDLIVPPSHGLDHEPHRATKPWPGPRTSSCHQAMAWTTDLIVPPSHGLDHGPRATKPWPGPRTSSCHQTMAWTTDLIVPPSHGLDHGPDRLAQRGRGLEPFPHGTQKLLTSSGRHRA